ECQINGFVEFGLRKFSQDFDCGFQWISLFSVHRFECFFVSFTCHFFCLRSNRTPNVQDSPAVICSLLLAEHHSNFESRFTFHVLRITHHASRITCHPTTSIPILLAVPATTRKPASSVAEFKSFAL